MTVPGDPELPDHELPLQGIIIIYARINTCKQQAERGDLHAGQADDDPMLPDSTTALMCRPGITHW